jgi:hypothetical protein
VGAAWEGLEQGYSLPGVGWEYLVAKVTTTCHGTLPWRWTTWKESAAPDEEAVGGDGGREEAAWPCLQKGSHSTLPWLYDCGGWKFLILSLPTGALI